MYFYSAVNAASACILQCKRMMPARAFALIHLQSRSCNIHSRLATPQSELRHTALHIHLHPVIHKHSISGMACCSEVLGNHVEVGLSELVRPVQQGLPNDRRHTLVVPPPACLNWVTSQHRTHRALCTARKGRQHHKAGAAHERMCFISFVCRTKLAASPCQSARVMQASKSRKAAPQRTCSLRRTA